MTGTNDPTAIVIDQAVINDMERLTRLLQAPQQMLEATRQLASYDGAIAERKAKLAEIRGLIAEAEAAVPRAEAESAAKLALVKAAHDAKLEELTQEQRQLEANERETAGRVEALKSEVADLEARAASIRETIAAVRV